MLAIPLPFVVSLLLVVLAGSLWVQRGDEAKTACLFLLICALTTAVVGLRWSIDLALLRTLQPILAGLIPVAAWYVVISAPARARLPGWHAVPPALITLCALSYPWWTPPLDALLTAVYVTYGVALLRSTYRRDALPLHVRIGALESVIQAQRLAGAMLLFSAAIDGAMSIDFVLFDGDHATAILTLGHALLLPLLSLAVVFISLVTTPGDESVEKSDTVDADSGGPTVTTVHPDAARAPDFNKASECDADIDIDAVVERVRNVLEADTLYLDPDLTLARIARKAGIPARQVSHAVNQSSGSNISQLVNEYRVEHAKKLLRDTDAPVTQIYLGSGFQTKSNFHREFSRQVSMTPSAYRRSMCI